MNNIIKDMSSPHSLYLPTSLEAWRSLSLSPFPSSDGVGHQAMARPAGRTTTQVRPENPLPLLHPPCCLVVVASCQDACAPPVGETRAIMPQREGKALRRPTRWRHQCVLQRVFPFSLSQRGVPGHGRAGRWPPAARPD